MTTFSARSLFMGPPAQSGKHKDWYHSSMKCPHCLTAFHDNSIVTAIAADTDGGWMLSHQKCPACSRLVIRLMSGPATYRDSVGTFGGISSAWNTRLVHPKGAGRTPCPEEVPKEIAEDYNEACLVLPDSPKASAALSRRCLQNVLREAARVKARDLYDEIQEALDSGKLPSHIAEGLDAVRAIGNFGAHPIKSKHTGEIIPVEPGEAEWNLDVLESLFDFYYVQPALLKAKKDALNKKLQEAGKPAVR
jgi:Domain of unknown function (DUF4145)